MSVVLYSKEGTFLSDVENIAKITLNRVEAHNAFSTEVLNGIMDALDKAEADNDIRAVIITGAGEKAFSAGADLKSMTGLSLEEQGEFTKLGQKVFRRIEKFPKAVIAAINGFAFGGGMEIAMACDIRIASADAKMGTPEVKLGLIPAWGGSQRLIYLIGASRAREMILTGRNITAKEGEEFGLINKVVPADELEASAGFMAAQIADNAPLAIAAAKKSLDASRTMSIDEGNQLELELAAELSRSKDLEEGITALFSKRKPVFKGE